MKCQDEVTLLSASRRRAAARNKVGFAVIHPLTFASPWGRGIQVLVSQIWVAGVSPR